MSVNGLVTITSHHSVSNTIDRVAAAATAVGMAVFARIDHAAGAKAVGLVLRPTELLIFGNAKTGTPLMQSRQTIGIDLPLKVLAWEDDAGQVWLSHNDPAWLAGRHGLVLEGDNPMSAALKHLTENAAT